MRKSTKIWLIIATFFVIFGSVMFAAIMMNNQWDFMQLGTTQFETNTHLVNENFNNIRIQSNTADIIFVPSTDNTCKVVCVEAANERHTVSVEDQTLSIIVMDERQWYDHIGITTGSSQLTIYLPKTQYNQLFIKESTGDIKIPKEFQFESMDITASTGHVDNYASVFENMNISTSTGDIYIEGISANEINLSVSTGKIVGESITCHGNLTVDVSTGDTYLTDVTCTSLLSTGNTGGISLKNVIASDKFSIARTTGDVKFTDADASKLLIKTDTGDVTGNLLTDKLFFIETSTGDIEVPKAFEGGPCEITTSTGDIKITIE